MREREREREWDTRRKEKRGINESKVGNHSGLAGAKGDGGETESQCNCNRV